MRVGSGGCVASGVRRVIHRGKEGCFCSCLSPFSVLMIEWVYFVLEGDDMWGVSVRRMTAYHRKRGDSFFSSVSVFGVLAVDGTRSVVRV